MSAATSDPLIDCVVVGGGAAGLTCAIMLARYLRSVALISAGPPRNYASKHVHNYLGLYGISGAELLHRGREEAARVGVRLVDKEVKQVKRTGDLFTVYTEDETYSARRVVLAYGVKDQLPDIPEVERYYGSSVHHCPDCDGFEAAGEAIGVVGEGDKAAKLALTLKRWSDRIELFYPGSLEPLSEEAVLKLTKAKIPITPSFISGLVGTS